MISHTTLIASSVAKRIAHIRQERFLAFPDFQAALRAMNMVHNQPRKSHMDCLLVRATNGMGKTSAIIKFAAGHGVMLDRKRFISTPANGHYPIIALNVNGVMGEAHFYRMLIEACLGGGSDRIREPQTTALRMLEELKVRTLVLDEFQDFGRHTSLRQKTYLSHLKHVTNMVQIGIIGMSVYGPTAALQADPHLMSRFDVAEMPPWTESRQLLTFLSTMASMMSLHRGFDVANPTFVQTLLQRSKGSTKLIVKHLQGAAIHAVLSGHERLDSEMLTAYIREPNPEGCDVVDAEATA